MFEKVKLKTYLLAVFSAIIVLGGILTAVSVFGMGKSKTAPINCWTIQLPRILP